MPHTPSSEPIPAAGGAPEKCLRDGERVRDRDGEIERDRKTGESREGERAERDDARERENHLNTIHKVEEAKINKEKVWL